MEAENAAVEGEAVEGVDIEALRRKVDLIADRLGKPIDVGVKEAVVALWAIGFETDGSCEGHSDHGVDYPVVYASAPVPENVDEDDLYEQSKWREANMLLRAKLEALLDEYYEGDDSSIKLGIEDRGKLGPITFRPLPSEKIVKADLDRYQRDIERFSAFVVQKYDKSRSK